MTAMPPLFTLSCPPCSCALAHGLPARRLTRAIWQGLACAALGLPLLAQAQPVGAAPGKGPAAAASAAAEAAEAAEAGELAAVTVVGRAAPVPVELESHYQPTPDASTLRSLAPALEVPQVTNAVAAQVLRDQRPRHMDDALMNVSGITQGNTLAGTQDTIMKRGFGGNRDGSIMHNGMPLVQGRGMNAAAESVVVLKGPSSMFYGIMDPGGVVNVVSKKPQTERRTTVALSGSTYGHGRHGGGLTLDSTGPIGDKGLAWRLIVDHANEDYWRNFGKRRDTLVAPSLAWYGRDTQAVLWYEFRDYDVPFDRTVVIDPATKKPLALPIRRRLDEPFNQMWGNSHLLQSSIDHRIAPGWSGHISLSYNRETYDANQLRIQAVDTARGLLTRRADGTRGALSTDAYGTAYVDGSARLGGVRHDMQFGLDLENRRIYRADMIRAARTHEFDYRNPVYGRVQPSDRVVPSDSDQTDRLRNQSLFFQDAMHFGPQWIVVGGLRYLHWSQLAGRGRPFKINTNTRDGVWLPRLGLVYRLDSTKSLYASYSRSVKPVSSIAPHASGMVIDSSIAPEKGVSWEIGAKLDVPGGLTGSLALFDIDKKNVLVKQYNDATRRQDWRTAGAARSRGIELDVAGEVGRRWSLIGSLAWLDAKVTKDPEFAGNRLSNVARVTASAAATYNAGQVGAGQLRLGARARYIGRRPGDTANAFWLPAYTVADAFATYTLPVGGRPMKLQLNVKNLFDKVYYPSANNQYGLAAGDARQIALSVGFEF
ncbi:TonB-dependent siderophore receptor [Vandammella animalimorsus]|uniref:TonB-dependent siderophore receptor n=2 Tax=Vandammella animalimorsus TaxID=2029117 RepID=A0A2A2AGU6_9BURK|nr:TonB-dependent siderophore receptor [Vandammella animalimorsus]